MAMRLIMALVLSLHVACAKFPIRLYRTSIPASKLSTTNKDLRATEGKPSKNLPLADEIYQVEVAIGEPPQRMNLTLDYQRYHAYVFTNKRLRGTVACYACGATRNWFKLDASRTLDNSSAYPVGFNYHNPLYYQPYLPYTNECGSNVSSTNTENHRMPVYNLKDTFSIAGLTLESTPFFVVDGARGILNPAWKSDGILGLYRTFDTFKRVDSPLHPDEVTLDRILEAFQGPKTTALIYFDKEANTSSSSPGGLLTFGAAEDVELQTFDDIDDANCEEVWSYPDAEPNLSFTIRIQSVSLGKVNFVNTYKDEFGRQEHFVGFIISTSSFMRIPLPLLVRIVAALNASYEYDTDTYSVPCASVSSLPPLIFRIPFEHIVPPEDYARPVYNDVEGRCTLMLSSKRPGDDYGAEGYDVRSIFRLGTTFTRSYCLLLDYSNGSVALAKKMSSKNDTI